MPVTFDAVGTAQNVAAATSANIPITLGGGDQKVVIVHFVSAGSTAGLTATVAGFTLTVLANTTTTNGLAILGVAVSNLSGAQTVAVSWQSSQNARLDALSFAGVNQSSAFNGGQNTTTASVTVTSTSGDMTSSCAFATAAIGTNQTLQWSVPSQWAGDIGPGTGTTTHTWTNGNGVSGINIAQAAALSSTYAGGWGFLL